VKLWRVARAAHARTGPAAFSGIGGLSVDGRWHTRGRPIVYTARTESLAKLEALVHFKPAIAPRLVLVEATIPDALVAILRGAPPGGWDAVPDNGAARSVGDSWLQSASSLALEVPSVHSRSETNVLINPAHPDFAHLVIGTPMPFAFDQRLA
jgi:RES domain-containing protein